MSLLECNQEVKMGVFLPLQNACSHIAAQTDFSVNWVAVKELNLSYYIGETLLFTIYTHYGNLL